MDKVKMCLTIQLCFQGSGALVIGLIAILDRIIIGVMVEIIQKATPSSAAR